MDNMKAQSYGDAADLYVNRLKKGTYALDCQAKSADERKADARHKRQVEETKKLIERLRRD